MRPILGHTVKALGTLGQDARTATLEDPRRCGGSEPNEDAGEVCPRRRLR